MEKLMLLENKLVILLSKMILVKEDIKTLESILKDSVDWEIVVKQLKMHKITALAHYNLYINELLYIIPRNVKKILEMQYYENKHKQETFDEHFLPICSKFQSNGIKYCVLKGYILQKILYPAHTRYYNDIDVLIQRDSYPLVMELLNDLGYFSEKSVLKSMNRKEEIYLLLNTYELPQFIKEVDNEKCKLIKIDLQHQYSFYKQYQYNVEVEKELQFPNYFINNEVIIPYQPYHELLIHLCAHAFGDSTVVSEIAMGKAFRLRSFADIYSFLSKFEDKIDNIKFVQEVISRKVVMPVYFCLYYIQEIFGTIQKANKLLKMLKLELQDESFLFRCGIENGFKNSVIWEETLEGKLFNATSIKDVENRFAILLKDYSQYDNRWQ
jgi:hypothetical protein